MVPDRCITLPPLNGGFNHTLFFFFLHYLPHHHSHRQTLADTLRLAQLKLQVDLSFLIKPPDVPGHFDCLPSHWGIMNHRFLQQAAANKWNYGPVKGGGGLRCGGGDFLSAGETSSHKLVPARPGQC